MIYVELPIKGDKRALVDVASIIGVIYQGDAQANTPPDQAMTVLIRGGESLEVFAMSPADVLRAAQDAKDAAKETSADFLIMGMPE